MGTDERAVIEAQDESADAAKIAQPTEIKSVLNCPQTHFNITELIRRRNHIRVSCAQVNRV
jgi:hypothetical protein